MNATTNFSALDARYRSREFKPQPMNWANVRGTYARPIAPPAIELGRLQAGQLTPLPNLVAPLLDTLPGDISKNLTREFWQRHGQNPEWERKFHAQTWLSSEVEKFIDERLDVAFDDTEIRDRAERFSQLCGKMQRLEVMQDFARSKGCEPPTVHKTITRVSASKRLQDSRWWRRQLRKHWTRRAEVHLRAVGLVHKRKQLYASDHMVRCRKGRKARDAALLKELIAVSDAGDQLELYEIAEKSQANPALRRAELMTRLRGFEEVANLAGHVALFFTLTCPSAFHCMHNGQAWLCKMWARVRAKLRRLSVVFYGFRIAEPHHDGTPHWHAVLFVPSHQAGTLSEVIAGMWLSEYAHEAGAKDHRCKVETIRPEAGTATGYLAKYVAKNIDGFEVGNDYEAENTDAKETCARVAAWASAHGIRQFQQIGGPPVSVWRELRRIRSEVINSAAIEAARKAADAGEWANFVGALGGVGVGKSGRVSLYREHTGELNRFDEMRGPQIAGVQSVSSSEVRTAPFQGVNEGSTPSTLAIRVRTREKVWRIERKKPCSLSAGFSSCSFLGSGPGSSSAQSSIPKSDPSSLGPVSITVRGSNIVPSAHKAGNTGLHRKEVPPWLN
jgi:hypothetical protein